MSHTRGARARVSILCVVRPGTWRRRRATHAPRPHRSVVAARAPTVCGDPRRMAGCAVWRHHYCLQCRCSLGRTVVATAVRARVRLEHTLAVVAALSAVPWHLRWSRCTSLCEWL